MRKEIDIQRTIKKPDEHSYWLKPEEKQQKAEGSIDDNNATKIDEEIHDSRGFKSFVDTKVYVDILGKNPIYKDLV